MIAAQVATSQANMNQRTVMIWSIPLPGSAVTHRNARV